MLFWSAAKPKKGKDAPTAPEVVPAEISTAVHAWDGSIQQLLALSSQVCSLVLAQTFHVHSEAVCMLVFVDRYSTFPKPALCLH